jgi:hypothetical protein
LLARELELYKTIFEATNLPIKIADRLLQEVKLERSKIDDDELFGEQTSLIKKINKNLSKDVYTNFVPHYKSLATIAQLFSLHLKVYLNEEISRLKSSVARALESKEISEDSFMVEKTRKVLSLLEGFKDKDIDAGMLKQILKIQSLVREVGV